MKYALNGALTIGTLDGANIEIMEEVGRENIFIFGMTADQVNSLKQAGYSPRDYYYRHPELKQAIDMINNGTFAPGEPELFRPIVDTLMNGDNYMLFADYASYIECQDEVDPPLPAALRVGPQIHPQHRRHGQVFQRPHHREYAREIWDVKPETEVH
jgi:starch phosphorylase